MREHVSPVAGFIDCEIKSNKVRKSDGMMRGVAYGGPNFCLSPHQWDGIPNPIGSLLDHVIVGPCTAENWMKAKRKTSQISLTLEKGDESVDVLVLFADVWRLGWISDSIQEQTRPDSRNSVICLQMVLRFTANPN